MHVHERMFLPLKRSYFGKHGVLTCGLEWKRKIFDKCQSVNAEVSEI